MSCDYQCQWNGLPVEIKIAILHYLPFRSLMRFMFLSKESHLLALQAKIRVERVIYRYHCVECQPSINLTIAPCRYDDYLRNNYELKIFSQAGGCVIHFRGGLSIRYEQDIELVGMQLLLYYTKLLDIQDLAIELSHIPPGFVHMLQEQLSGVTLQAKNFKLTSDNSMLLALVPFLKSHSSSIVFWLRGGVHRLVSKIFDYEAVCTARILSVLGADLFDEQLCRLQASKLTVMSPHITSRSINYLLRQFKGGRQISLITIATKKPLHRKEVFDGIDPRHILKPNFDRVEAGGLHGRESHAGELHSDHGVLYFNLNVTCCSLKSLQTTNPHYVQKSQKSSVLRRSNSLRAISSP